MSAHHSITTSSCLGEVRQALQDLADHKIRESGQRFFKEPIKTYGVKLPEVNKISAGIFNQLKKNPKADVFRLCGELWASGYFEESIVACNWSYRMRKFYVEADFDTFEGWVTKYVTNWASCDTLCNHTIGAILEKYPVLIDRVKGWAGSENRWVRRASAVSLIIPARKGLFLPEVLEIAESLLTDDDDLVRKGYGWLLKTAAGTNRAAVFDFIMHYKNEMPRTALRYAIEKMPPDLKSMAMEKNKEGPAGASGENMKF
ncbi:MAG: DNA alkylation repair protein [Cytophagaceae bacterium SCN 52-12]|nr:MAG: DNA alkylation repair protein [Cytophagaceae bacterium SCN 52-12]